MLTLLFVLGVTREPWPALSMIAKSSPLSWIGGIFGTVYIVASIMLLPRLGAMTVIALLITGRCSTSAAFDHFGLFGLAQRPIDLYRAGGAVLLVLAVLWYVIDIQQPNGYPKTDECPLLALSGHRRAALHMSAIGGKADMTFCTANVRL